jgi:hypothetical protein
MFDYDFEEKLNWKKLAGLLPLAWGAQQMGYRWAAR